MRSARPSRTVSTVDLTTRARIRDAAVLRFARDGFGTPLRTIAADADVSAGLVIYHFGTKDKLREACDAHILQEIKHAKQESLAQDGGGRFLEYFATAEVFAPIFGYVVRSLQQGGPLARSFVDHMIEDAATYLREGVAAGVLVPSRNDEARARYLVMSSLGATLLAMTLDPPAAPDEPAEQEGPDEHDEPDLSAMMRRHYDAIALPALELFSEGLLTTRRMLDDYLTYVGDPPAAGDEDVAS